MSSDSNDNDQFRRSSSNSSPSLNSLIEQVSNNLSSSVNNTSENLSPDDQRWLIEQLQNQNNQCPSNKTPDDEIEGLQSGSLHSHQPSNPEAGTNPSGENTQLVATGNEFPNEQRNDLVNFGHWYLKELQNRFENIVMNLTGGNIPVEYERFRQAYQHDPQIMLSSEGFNIFSSIIHYGQQLSQSNSQQSFTGEESDRIAARNTSAPSDDNGDHTHEEIQALTQSDPMVPHIAENNSSSVPPLDLTLLLEQLETIQGEFLMNLKLIHPPRIYWHARTINCLARHECALLQSTKQRELIVLEWSSSSKKFQEKDLFVYVKLLGYNGDTHLSKFIVPPETEVTNIADQIILINKEYGCNLMNQTILYPLTKVKSDNHPNQIALPIHMFNSFKIKHSQLEQNATKKKKEAEEIALDFIKNEIVKICKLRTAMCRLTDNGQLERVSEYVDTNLIKESKGTEELKPIDRSQIVPVNPCECGEVDVDVHLNTNSEKSGFIVTIDGQQLDMHQFKGVTNNTITIHPPEKEPGVDGFDLIIEKLNVFKTIQENRDPWDVRNLDGDKDTLWNGRIKYSEHACPGDHSHENKRARKK